MVDIANYVADYAIDSAEAYDTARYMLLDSLGTRDAGDEISRVRQAPRPAGARCHPAWRRARAGDQPRAGPGAGGLRHRHADPLARLQRHLAGGRVGPSVGQPRRDPGCGRLPQPQGAARGRPAADRARRARLRDQGARDPGLLRAEEQLQPRRPGPRDPGAAGLHRGGHAHARRRQGADHHRGVAQLDRQRRAAHLPPRAQHRPAQELGRR